MNARSQFARRTLVAAISACFAGNVFSAPQAPTVAAGQAGFQQSGNTLTITNTPGTIINWQSFSINRDEVVRFMQQSASSQVLNRVTGIDPSVILGQLQSNGRVLLINPNGVLFGKGSQVDVAGLLVSTLQLKDADFLAGRYKFNDTPGAGSIENQGSIKTAGGGHVVLIAPKVENSGIIQSPEGHILLAAGRSVTLADPDKPAIQVEVSNRDNTAVNLGTLIAKNVSIYGGIIKNSGLIQATTAIIGENGKIRLQAKYDVENTGTLQASGTQGGDILIQASEGVVRVQGTVEAKGSLPTFIPENGPKSENTGKGGRIEILAPEIVVDGVVDASGTTGGGAIFIGGQYQGGNSPVPTDWSANPALQRASLSLDNPYATSPSVTATATSSGDSSPLTGTTDQNAPLIPNRNLPTARTTTIGANARIRADGLDEGDGGVIVAWSDESTHVAGLITAHGGQHSGNGGLIETSGKIGLVIDNPVDASAVAGRAGLWLLDPNNVQITNGTDANASGNPNFTTTNDTAIISAVTIQTALNAGTNVTISTGTSGSNAQAGDILVSAAINVTPAADTKLTLQAHNNITFSVGLLASGSNKLNLDLIPDSDASGSGKAVFATSINLNGGALQVLGSGVADFFTTTINAASITAGTANFSSGSPVINATSSFTNLNVTGGSISGTGAVSAQNVVFTGGWLGGSGGVSISNSLDWQAGTFYGATVLSSGATATLSTTSSKVLGANFTNDGTLIINSGRIQINSGFTLQNSAGATINLNSSDSSPIYFGTGNATFNNLGTLNQLATGTHEINLSLGTYNNSGSVNVQAGTLRLRNTGTDSGSYVLAAGASLESSAGAIRTFSGSITGGGTFSVSGGTATIGSGAAISSGLALTSGRLNIATGAAQTVSTLSLTGGTLNASDSLTVTGAATLSGGTLTGNLTTQGASTLGMFYLAGGNWINQSVATLGGSSYISLSSGTNSITNAVGATLNLNTSNAFGVFSPSGATGVFNNAGTLVQQASGAHEIWMGTSSQFNNTGLVSVQAGTLQIGAPGSSTGTFDIASGATLATSRNVANPFLFAAGSSITGNGTFQVPTGTVNVQGSLASTLTLGVSGGTLNLASGASKTVSALSLTGGTLNASDSLTVTGAATLSGGTLTGNLTTQGASTLGMFYLAGGNWINQGVATLGGSGYISLSSGTNSITNEAGATLNLNTSNPYGVFSPTGTATGVFNNAGTLVQQASGAHEIWMGTSSQFNNTGLVSVQAGTLQMGSPGSSTGTFDIASGAKLELSRNNATPTTFAAGSSITGNGTFQVATGTVNVQVGLASTLTLGVSGGTLNLTSGASRTVSALNLTSGTLNASDSLTVTGASTLNGGTLSGTLTTQGASTANGSLNLSESNWLNQGVVTIGGSGYIYQLSGTNSITNAVGGTFNLNTSSVYAINSSSATGVFNNYGTVVHQASGSHQIWMGAGGQFNNTGTVDVQAGTLQLQAGGSDTGNYAVASGAALSFVSGTRTVSGTVSGAGSMQNAGGTTTFAAGSTIGTSQVSLTAGTLTLNDQTLNSLSLVGGALNALGAATVTGAASLAGSLSGSGSLTTSGTTTVGNFSVIGGGTWNNAGVATLSGATTMGLSNGTLNNLAGGTLNLNSTAATVISVGSGANAVNNAGTLTQQASGTHAMYLNSGTASFNNTGTVDVQAGTLQIGAGGTDTGNYSVASGATLTYSWGTRTVNGAVSGAGTLQNGGATTTFAAGSNISAAQLLVSAGSLTVNGSLSPSSVSVSAGTLTLNAGTSHTVSTLSLTGGTLSTTDALTATGVATLNGVHLSGGGSLTTSGTTAVGALWINGGTTWNNSGTATLGGYNAVYLEGGTINNRAGGAFNLNSTYATPIYFYSGTNAFNNAGTLTQQASGTYTMPLIGGAASFNNTGTVDVQVGTLQIGAGGTDTGSYTVAAGSTLGFTSGTRQMTSTSSVSGSGVLKLSSGSLQFLGSYSLPSAPQVTGGTLDFQPNNTVSLGAYTASTGTYIWGGNTQFTSYVNSGATSIFSNGLSASSVVVSAGTLNLSGRFAGGSLTKTGGTLNLSGAILDGDLFVANGQLVNVANGLTFENNHAIYLNDTGSTTTLSLNGAQTVGGYGRIVFNGTGANHRIFTNVSNVNPGIVFDTGVTVDVYNGSGRIDGAGASNQFFESRGMIYIDPGKTLGLQVIANITNSGTIYNEGTLSIDPSMSGPSNCCNFHNKGSLNALAGTVNLLGNGYDLGGVYSVSAGATLNFNGGGARTFTGSGARIDNAGTVRFASGTFNLGDGFAVSGVGGTNLVSGTLTVDGTASISNYAQSGGTLNGSGTLTATNTFNWTGGVMSGTGVTIVGAGVTAGAINILGGGISLSRTISNYGRIVYSTTGLSELTLLAGGALNIESGGVLELATDGLLSGYGYTNSAGQITNRGTIWKTGGTGTSTLGSSSYTGFLNDGGTLTSSSGTINLYKSSFSGIGAITAGAVNLAGGTGTFAGTLTGAGTLKLTGATLTVDGTASISNYAQSGGTLNGSGTLTATNSFNWTGGVMSGTGTTIVGAAVTAGAINILSGTNLYRTLSNYGRIVYSTTGLSELTLLAGGALNIESGGVLELATDGLLSGYGYTNSAGQITNRGTIWKTGGTGTSTLGSSSYTGFLNDGGTLTSSSGTINLYKSSFSGIGAITAGAVNLAGGTGTFAGTLTGAGTLKLTGATLTVDGTASISNYAQSSGTLNGSGTLTATNTFNWTGGTMSGTGTTKLAAGGTGSLSGSNYQNLYRRLRNEGSMSYGGAGAYSGLHIYTGGILDNAGVFDITDMSSINRSSGAVGNIINTGTFKKSGGPANSLGSDQIYAPFSNVGGVIEVSGSSLNFGNSVFSGSSIINGGQVTSFGTMTVADGSVLSGTGGVSFGGAGELNIAGMTAGLVVGAGVTLYGPSITGGGKLTNFGTIILSGKAVNVDLVNAGVLSVNGSNIINGGLDIEAGTITISSGGQLVKNGGSVNWHGGTLSGSGSLSLGSGATFNVNGSGVRVLNGLSLTASTFNMAGGSLDVQSGSLSLSGGVIASGTSMSLHGGTVTNSAALAVAGTLDLAGGTLAGTGGLNVSGTLQKTTTGTTTLAMAVNNAGTVDVQAGSLNLAGGGTHSGTFVTHSGTTLGFTGGTHSFGDGTHFSGAGSFAGGGTLNLTGTGAGLTVDAGTSVNLNALGFGGVGNLTNAGTLTGSGVTLGGALINSGTASLSGGAVNGGLTNTGNFNVIGTVTLGGSTATLAGGAINLGSGATLVKDGGMLYWSGGTFAGSGTLAYVNGGNFAFSGNGDRIIDNPNLTFAFSDLTLPNGSLTLNNGGLTFNGNTTMPAGTALNMYGGTITNNGPLNISGLFGLYGGTLAGAGAINMTGGTIDLPANSTVNWTATGTMSNSGTLNLSNRTITNAITNNGTINTTGGLIFTQLFTNQGTLNLNSGTTTFSAGILQNSGLTKLGTGGGASANVIAGGSGFNLAGGALSGSGNLAGDLTVGAASLSVGFSPGSLTINGNLNLSGSATTSIELGGTAPGSGYDTIAVTGTANLGGALNVTSYGGYTPAAGSSHDFMSFASSTGSFLSTNLPAGWAMSLTSTSSYLSLLMAAQVIAQTTGVSPLQALMQALAAASGSAGGTASDPGAMTMGGTTLDFSRVTPNDLATSLTQQLLSVTQVLPTNDFEDLKVCQ